MTRLNIELPHQDTPICDFCSATDCAFSYPTRDVNLSTLAALSNKSGGIISLNSRGWWLACQTCHELIQKGDRDGLAKRSTDSQKAAMKAIPYELLLGLVRHMHDQFWKSREGQPYRHDLARVPYIDTTVKDPDTYCHSCMVDMPDELKQRMHANFNAPGPCHSCGAELGYTEDMRDA